MTDFLKIAKSIVVPFAHICAYGVETVKRADTYKFCYFCQKLFCCIKPYTPLVQPVATRVRK